MWLANATTSTSILTIATRYTCSTDLCAYVCVHAKPIQLNYHFNKTSIISDIDLYCSVPSFLVRKKIRWTSLVNRLLLNRMMKIEWTLFVRANVHNCFMGVKPRFKCFQTVHSELLILPPSFEKKTIVLTKNNIPSIHLVNDSLIYFY